MYQTEAPRDGSLPRDVQQLIAGLPPDIIDAIHDLPPALWEVAATAAGLRKSS